MRILLCDNSVKLFLNFSSCVQIENQHFLILHTYCENDYFSGFCVTHYNWPVRVLEYNTICFLLLYIPN